MVGGWAELEEVGGGGREIPARQGVVGERQVEGGGTKIHFTLIVLQRVQLLENCEKWDI